MASNLAHAATGVSPNPFQVRIRLPALWLLAGLLGIAAVVALATGAVPISLTAILSGEATGLESTIFSEIRVPRVMLAGFVGAALGLCGAALQGLFRNPLADPGLIGVSSGAALGAISIIVMGPALGLTGSFAPYSLPLAAIAGALAVTAFLYAFSSRYGRFSVVTILLVGIAVNALASVGIGLFQFLSDDAGLRTLTFWMMGSFGRTTWTTALPAIAVMAAAAVPLLLLGRHLDALQLGEAEAFYAGVDVMKVKRYVILCSAIAVGSGVALSGIVGFVGLVVPHLVRLVLGPAHRYVLPGAVLLGASLTMLADTVSRTVVAPAEIPVSLVTSALGAPFFLWLISSVRPR